jgi:hypothetical protein
VFSIEEKKAGQRDAAPPSLAVTEVADLLGRPW